MENLTDKGLLKADYIFKIIFVSASILAAIGILQFFLHLEVKATLPTPDFLACYLAVGITLGITELLTLRKRSGPTIVSISAIIRQHKTIFAFYLVSVLLMFVCLVLNRSLSGILALLAAIIFVTISLYKKRAIYVILSCIGIFLIFPSTMKVFQLLGGETLKEFFIKRLVIWNRGLEIVSQRPFLGLGPGNFNFLSISGEYVKFAYNEYLQIGAEMGMIVLLFIFYIFYIIMKGLKKLLSSNLSPKTQAEVTAVLASGLVILTQGLFYFNLHLPAITYILVFFIAKIVVENHNLFISQISPNGRPGSVSDLQAPGWLRGVSISILTILLLFVSIIFLGNHYAYKGEYRKAVKFVPLNAEYHKELADYYRKEGKQDRAISIYEKIIKLHPTRADYHSQLGQIYYEQKDWVNALREFELAVKHNPYNPVFHFTLGSYYLDRQEFKKATLEYQKAVDIEPYYLLARLRLGESHLGLKEVERAKEEFYKILKLKELLPQLVSSVKDYEHRLFEFDYSLVYVGLGRCWMEEGNSVQAVSEYKKALKLNPYSADAHSSLADIYFVQKRYDLALNEMEKAIKLDPQNEVYRRNLKLIEDAIAGVESPSR